MTLTRNQRELVKELLFCGIAMSVILWLFLPYFNGALHIKNALGL